jgi:integrase
MKVKELKSEPIVIEWLCTINAKPNTQKSYLAALQAFTEYTNKKPEELLLEAEEEISKGKLVRHRTIKKYYIGFRKQLQDRELAPLTVRIHISGVKNFYKTFDIEIPNLPRSGNKAIPLEKHKDIPTKEDLQEVLKVCDPLEGAVLLVGVSSGLSANEIINLKVKHFKDGFDSKTAITTLKLRREKVGFDFITFLTPEASNSVLKYLDYRNREPKFKTKQKSDFLEKQRTYSDNDYLFITRSIPQSYLINRKENHRKLTSNSIIKLYRKLSEDTGKNTSFGNWNLIRSHNVRKFFNSALLNAGCDSFFVEFFMGHTLDDTKTAYFRASPDKLKEIYIKFVPYLTIQKELDPAQHPDFIRLKKESDIYARAAATATVERSELIELKNEIKELAKFQNEDQESRRQTRLMKQILAVKYSSEIPKNIDTSEWFKEHEKLMETDLNYKKDYELCEKLESIEGFTESEEFQRALENGDKESKERKKELANILNKLTLEDS